MMNDAYFGWAWILWFGMLSLFFLSSFGNWGYTYRAYRLFEQGSPGRTAIDMLNERYASGDIDHEEYLRMKSHILPEPLELPRKSA